MKNNPVYNYMANLVFPDGCSTSPASTLHQQLCRWLLLSLDRLHGTELVMSQELIANMLGVRRVGVTEAAQNLQRLGVIDYKRGRIRVLDRARLEKCACECYAVVKREYERLLPDAVAV